LADISLDIYQNSFNDKSLSEIDSGNLRMPYQLKMHKIYLLYIRDKDLSNAMSRILSAIDKDIASIYMKTNEFDMAECYCEQALSHARLFKGSEEEKK
jgi:hypothetical protein